MFSSFLRRRAKCDSCSSVHQLILVRYMGGGPRTFPGGLNKWQWKRLHEKKAREKEKRLLEQEKQLYEARIRSEVRAKLWGKPESEPKQVHGPMSPKEHIKALADRFMKAGAEDLWNADDGPSSSDVKPGASLVNNRLFGSINSPPIDVKKIVSESHPLTGNKGSVSLSGLGISNMKSRKYSVVARGRFKINERSSGDQDLSLRFVNDREKLKFKNTRDPLGEIKFPGKKQRGSAEDADFALKNRSSNSRLLNRATPNPETQYSRKMNAYINGRSLLAKSRFQRNGGSSSDDDLDSDSELESTEKLKGWVNLKKMGSTAALGKYDMKLTKRIPLKSLEDEVESFNQVEAIREELRKRKAAEIEKSHSTEDSIYSESRFDECGISQFTVKALSSGGYVRMTRVQEATLNSCLEGKDALVKAKTGTGKSAAFLIPAIETVINAASSGTNHRVPPVYVLVICPTRELASQLAAVAKALLKFHEGIGVQTLVGGTRFKLDQRRLESEPFQILVATPGRLLDHIENKSGLTVRLMGLKMLILDEADLLLDLGFRKDLEKIVDCLPRQRQSLLFSATIPKEVRRVSQLVLKREHLYIDIVGLGHVETPAQVKQSCMIAPHESHFQLVYHLLKDHISQTPDYKVIVFCSTGMVTSLMYTLLLEMKMNVREIHARKPQHYRARVSEEFKDAKRLILVTSDVTARGMNYPDVTLVIQMGIPCDREQYIHRLGRTGREGKHGEGILLLAPWESYFLDELRDLPLESASIPHIDSEVQRQIEESMGRIDTSVKEAAYHAWLGYYNSIREIGRDKTELSQLASRFCRSMGLEKPPPLFRKTAVKMGLKDIPGIRIRK